jgi:hypothetical protein
MIHGWRGLGKTHIAMGVAASVASGKPFLTWECTTPRNVLYVDGELPIEILKERAQTAFECIGVPPQGNLRFITPELQTKRIPCLANPDGQKHLERYLDGIDLLILDNLSTLAGSNIEENSADSWSIMQDWLVHLRGLNLAVILVHHSGKSGQQRGTSRREDVLDTVIGLSRPKDYQECQGCRVVISFEKDRIFASRGHKNIEASLFLYDGKHTWETRTVEQAKKDYVIQLLDDGLTNSEIAKAVDCDKAYVSRIKKQWENDQGQNS